MKEITLIIQLCLFVIFLVAAFYYVISAIVNISIAIFAIVGYTKAGSALPLLPSIVGVVAGLIASLGFHWLSVWLAISLAILPDAFLLFCILLGGIILSFRMIIGFAPKDDVF